MTVKGSPADAYRKFVSNVGDWWNSAHTFSGKASNLSIDDKPMGCFCEKLPDGGGVRHMEVVFAAPGTALGMTGAMGPMQTMALTGSMRLQFSKDGESTKVVVSYALSGYVPSGINNWAPKVDAMLSEQFTRFGNYVDTGVPEAKK